MSNEEKVEKEAKVLGVREYTKGDMKITETAKEIDETTDSLTTPWGTKVKANDVITVLEEYYALSDEDRENEKEAWVALIGKMMGKNDEGMTVVDIILSPTGNREIKFVYR